MIATMNNLNDRLVSLNAELSAGTRLKVAIIGLGSVGNFLLDYLMSWPETNVEIHVAGRDIDKMEKDVNIARVASGIRFGRAKTVQCHKIDLENKDSIAAFFAEVKPHITVNSSRVYSGLKYGSISWHNIRAYGLWCPLSIKYIRNIMLGYAQAGNTGIVINTSYSDAVIPWLKSAGLAYPDLGSGNLNHLIPRIKFAVARQLKLDRIDDLDVVLSTSHFHDVVISKEGQDEGVAPLINISLAGKPVNVDMQTIWPECAIAMPTDAKRNMMNASSNFEIISKIIAAIRQQGLEKFHIPGADGEIGGYPVKIDFTPGAASKAYFNEDFFSLDEMRAVNRASIYLDGIEQVKDGALFYTDELIAKVKDKFKADLPKRVHFTEIDQVAEFIIEEIIKKNS